jgi:hypothetical protein
MTEEALKTVSCQHPRKGSFLGSAFVFLLFQTVLFAQLDYGVSDTKRTGAKAVVTLSLTNNFPEKIESARATIFLLDDTGKVITQKTRWILGGTPAKSGLESKAATKFHFVLETDKSFQTNRVILSRVVLAGGKDAKLFRTP